MSRNLKELLTDKEAETIQEAMDAIESASDFIFMDKDDADHFMVVKLDEVAKRLHELLQ